ncbi:hypothetical protein CYK65_15565 [Clostridium perfringens]|uniref:hypothetical protein n=1 Tax=Clostridium perfringens TaxID=1502 RepID=UPI000D71CC67|nr:hypothetical protein [Clostridium perfringens]PWX16698.1 hypothetical protein CYK65_15565 [Clostridium perfringens]
MMDTLIGMLTPFMIRLSFIMFVVASVYLIWLIVCSMKEKINNRYEMIEETKESYDESTVYRAIIVLGNREIKVEIDDYNIEDTIIKIKTKDEKLYLTDIKNIVLISNKYDT